MDWFHALIVAVAGITVGLKLYFMVSELVRRRTISDRERAEIAEDDQNYGA